MMIESSLAQQTSVFADSLNVKEAPSVEKTAGEKAEEFKVPEQKQGDTVSISMEAKALVAAENSEESDTDSPQEQRIKMLQDQIEKLQEEIKELQDSDELTEKEKLQQIQGKQVQLMELQKQLAEAQETLLEPQGVASGGGTRANGFGNSVDSF